MPTAITTSSRATATAYSNQRKVDRTSNGVLWAFVLEPGYFYQARYSTDNGATWTNPGDASGFLVHNGSLTLNHTANASVFIDVDDYAHAVYKASDDGQIYYRRGTPNAARTAWTWSAAVQVAFSSSLMNHPDIVAHREGTGWRAHIVASLTDGTALALYYWLVTIDSAGAITMGARTDLLGNVGGTGAILAYPSIDFHHTGDGKTVAAGTPHLYVGFSHNVGTLKGVNLKKAVYSAGSWTWAATRSLDTRWVSTNSLWLNCLFDGTRVILPGLVTDGSGLDVMLYERDEADTTTTARLLIDNATTAVELRFGSSSYDGNGNVYFVGANLDEAAGARDLVWRKWTRSGASLGAENLIDPDTGTAWATAKRGYSASRVEFIYTDGTASPFTVTFDAITLNAPPNAPGLLDPANASTQNLAAGYAFKFRPSDPDAGDATTAYAFRRKVSGAAAYEFWNASTGAWQSTEVFNALTVAAGADATVTFGANLWTNGNVYNWSARTRDNAGAEGEYASDNTVTAGQPPTVTVTAPSGTIGDSNRPVIRHTYSDPENDPQASARYKVFTLATATATGFDPGTSTAHVWDSGEIASSTIREKQVGVDLDNGVSYRAYVQAKQSGGQASAWAFSDFNLVLDPPALPTFVVIDEPVRGRVAVAVQGHDNLLPAAAASYEDGTTGGWAGANATVANDTGWAAHGGQSLRITPTSTTSADSYAARGDQGAVHAPLERGRTYTISGTINTPAAQTGTLQDRARAIVVFTKRPGGSYVETRSAAGPATGVARVTVTVTVPEDADEAFFRLYNGALSGGGDVLWDAIKVEPGPDATAFSRGGLAGLTVAVVERAIGSGPWREILESRMPIAASTQALTVYDHEAPPDRPVRYRVLTGVEL